MMAIFTFLLIAFAVLLFLRGRSLKRKNQQLQERFRREEEADFYRNTLAEKLFEMAKSPLTTHADWREMLPMGEYADWLYGQTHRDQKFIRLAPFVQQQMAEKIK